MAGLVIMCMFIFVLSSGVGRDPLQRLTELFGMSRRSSTTVAIVSGKKVTDLDLENLRRQREMANALVSRMTYVAGETAYNDLLKDSQKSKPLEEFDQNDRISLSSMIRQRQERFQMDQWGAQFGAAAQQFFPGRWLTIPQRKDQVFSNHEMVLDMERLLRDKNQTEQARRVRQLLAVLEHEMWLRDKPQSEVLYFGGSLKVNDLLDFDVWRRQADKLGITLTRADIRAAINREAFNYQPLEENDGALVSRVQRMVPNPNPNLTAQMIYDALSDELRVCLAKCAVLGDPPGVRYYRYVGTDLNSVPSTATPNDFWKFFQDNRTTLRVEMLPIKVSDFLGKVGQPPKDDATKQELRDLFERHKDDEYNPDRDQPAFREPRRVSVEWVSARQDSPHQRKQAENFMLSTIATGAAGNPIPAWALSTQIIEKYDQGKSFTYPMPGLLDASYELAFYRNPPKPADVASALGLAMGNLATGASPDGIRAGVAAGIYGRHRPDVAAAVASESQRRVGVDATLVLTGLNPWAEAGVLSYADRADQVLPLDVVKKEVMDQVRDGLARNFLVDALKSVQTELEKLKGRPTEDRKKEAEKFLAQAVKDQGLSHGTTEKPRDFFDIEEDKGLKSMRESYRVHPLREDPRGKFFAALFFGNAPSYMPQRWPIAGMFGEAMWQMSEEPFLYWTTEEKKAYTPTYEEAEKKVIEAWRLRKAGELALKEAERIQLDVEKAKAKGNGLKVLREEQAKNPGWGEIFPLSNIARLVDVFTGGLALRQYAPYQADEDRIKARPDFVAQLMRALKENGDASIVWNRPGSIYYVVLLTDIHRPDQATFYRDYANPHVLGDNLWRYMEAERRKQFHEATMQQLRAEAGAPKGKWDVPEDIRKRIEGRDSGGDE